ncbi:type II toxin-antitoxin system PemK/MazF family toxin [Aquibaculum arenosum]|uniref:Type II toxin-antitoxin system PemK/MazF family toxin n=1 Tax=Aquibaculum arenosum TaxID=3032591 RepID=A0ABT5YQS7_9PROT|nr:type II toxin-antitoxin system PemK/MazF family toxin [Fodinicurvata sp. CAU 1616]MDF2097325.1 type II toxin-antitoxin system PemK/MazF family toxin [Fodinicurvata sp. CAU 1616]
MAIKYDVQAGTLLLCDYDLGGFKPPEMVKRRPVVVISPRLRHRSFLCTVVPLSTTAPAAPVRHQCRIVPDRPLPGRWSAPEFWAKADMLATVGFKRLDLFRTERDQLGKRKYIHPKLHPDDLQRVRACVLCALGLDHLNIHL